MGRRVVWITVWTTLSLWLGGITACSTQPEPTPAGLPDDRVKSVEAIQQEMKQTAAQKLPAAGDIAAPAPESPVKVNAVAPAPASPPVVAPPAALPATSMPEKAAAQLREGVVIAAAAQQVQGFDRSNWPKVATGPTVGVTTHNPVYFHDCPISDESAAHVSAQAPVEEQLSWAWSGAKAGNYAAPNTLGLFVQPAKYCTDLILLPGRLLIECPFKTVTAP